MINFRLSITNPWCDRWDIVRSFNGKTPFKNKFWELQIDKTNDIFSVDFRFTVRQDHAGMFLSIGLIGYDIIFNFYDHRHWNNEQGRWYFDNEDSGWR